MQYSRSQDDWLIILGMVISLLVGRSILVRSVLSNLPRIQSVISISISRRKTFLCIEFRINIGAPVVHRLLPLHLKFLFNSRLFSVGRSSGSLSPVGIIAITGPSVPVGSARFFAMVAVVQFEFRVEKLRRWRQSGSLFFSGQDLKNRVQNLMVTVEVGSDGIAQSTSKQSL